MSYTISIVTFNRRPVLQRVLQAIYNTCPEPHRVFVADNASTDDTAAMLADAKAQNIITDYQTLPENLGTDLGRNASHWAECIGHDTIRMDDKVLPLAAGWLTALKLESERNHAIVATPYDESVMPLYRLAAPVEFVLWPHDQGRGGPLIYVPSEATEALGACDELHPGHKYGWTDCLYIERAMLLGWQFGWALHVPVEYLARANPERRNSAMQWHALYMERRRQYQEAERDVFIDVQETMGFKAGMEARG